MSCIAFPHLLLLSSQRQPRQRGRIVGRAAVAVLLSCMVLAAAIPAVLYAHVRPMAPVSGSPAAAMGLSSGQMRPADLYMWSIVTDDGALGWHQLCPALKAQLSMTAVVAQANAERGAAARQGVHVSARFVRSQRQRGSVVYVYIATAYWSNGATQSKSFTVITQPSGCVEDVQMW